MDKKKKKTILFAAISVLIAGGAGTLIYFQRQSLAENRVLAENLRTEIDTGRRLVAGTPDLEREVIVQRETDAVIKEILSEEAEVTNFARTINDYAAQAEVAIKSVKRQKEDTRSKGKAKDFGRVGYTIQFDADAFQLLAFLNAFETHKRFISVTSFKLSAAKRASAERGLMPMHSVTLDLETYVYHPKEGATEVRIDNYERKRDLLLADIQKRSDELRVPVYEYRGPRGRRDPWVDPRLPVSGNPDLLSIEEQIQIVETLEVDLKKVQDLWQEVADAENLIQEMKARAALEEALVALEEQIRRVESQNAIVFGPSAMRLQNVIVGGVADVKTLMEQTGGDIGPSAKEIEQVAKAVRSHITREEYELAIQAYRAMEPRLVRARRDPRKAPLIDDLQTLAERAQVVLDFEDIDMSIGGVAVMEGARPVALINGETFAAGEFLGFTGDLFINDIRSHEIEFVYQGVTLIRRIDERDPFTAPTKSKKR